MVRAVRAGVAYFALVFLAGFILGTLRTLAVAPAIGEGRAVVLELPLMLVICWVSAGLILRRIPLVPGLWPRLVMGAVAFGLLMVADLWVALDLMGRSLYAHLAHLATLSGALGFAGQLAFAAFPALRR
ncbi:hypothetical protein RGUI_1882 [Rhodovulum sp. P5]|uniref:hypothetical protein n=1 Tax=Rhodovulum sp. P5 TaxID=1564506 RepID=UPI0009C25904|nr:hypothetical protein [Rhodovulum sp. P5]ARE40023.1 hypothetical protein RGUI_1882 [Rhodovulum sp. P5]